MEDKKLEEARTKYLGLRSIYSRLACTVESILKMSVSAQLPEVKIATYTNRAKDMDSFVDKCKKDKYSDMFQITDMAGVRAIAYRYSDVQNICSVIRDNFTIDEPNSIDKDNNLHVDQLGYRASHLVVLLGPCRDSMIEYQEFKGLKCEIQVTSLLQHVWSEITHKQYKSSGDFPKKLLRQMNLLEGLLEVAENEVDRYIEDFNSYTKSVVKMTEQGDYGLPINSMTLETYMINKFNFIQAAVFRDVDLILDEMQKFGLRRISDLDGIIRPDYFKELKDSPWRSFDGIIRNILILKDAERYFELAWSEALNPMNRKNYDLYKRYGITIDEICKKKHIQVAADIN